MGYGWIWDIYINHQYVCCLMITENQPSKLEITLVYMTNHQPIVVLLDVISSHYETYLSRGTHIGYIQHVYLYVYMHILHHFTSFFGGYSVINHDNWLNPQLKIGRFPAGKFPKEGPEGGFFNPHTGGHVTPCSNFTSSSIL